MQLFYVHKEEDIYKIKPSIGSPSTKSNYTEVNQSVPRAAGFRRSFRKPVNINPIVSNLISQPGQIDVLRNFDWTATPKNNSNFPVNPPSIQLIERDLITSTFAAELQYFIRSADDTISESGQVVGDVFNGIINTIKSLGIAEEVNAVQDFVQNNTFIQQAGSFGSEVLNNIRGGIDQITSSINNINSFDLDGILEPYDGLYLTKQTGFIYNLPYFTNTLRNINNDFGDTYKGVGGAIPSTLLEVGYSGLDLLSVPVAVTQPGAYIERPKYYQFSSQGEAVTFTFPLLNTIRPEAIENNYQLLWMLTYQNRPYRRNRVLVNPSRIYTVNIPGVRYVPFAFISNLDIQFQGTRREVVINFPAVEGGGMRPVNVIVPEAYQVTITLESLTNESANFMLKSVINSYQ